MNARPKNAVARIEPDPKWFGNVRTIGQKDLEKLRVELKEKVDDSYTVLLNKRKLPMSLIEEDESAAKINILEYEKFEVRLKIYRIKF
jgi:nuclear GTP-binding protein